MIGQRRAKRGAARAVGRQRNWNGDRLFVVVRRKGRVNRAGESWLDSTKIVELYPPRRLRPQDFINEEPSPSAIAHNAVTIYL